MTRMQMLMSANAPARRSEEAIRTSKIARAKPRRIRELEKKPMCVVYTGDAAKQRAAGLPAEGEQVACEA